MAGSPGRTALFETTRQLLPLVLADDLTDGLVVIDPESRIRYANPAMTRIFAYARDELEGEPLTLLMPEEYRERHREALERYLATGVRSRPWSDVELPGRHRDGHRLDLRISFTEFSQNGRRLFAGTIRDLTGADDPETERRLLVRSYRALFEANVAAVFRTAPDGRILAANQALARMMGLADAGELTGRSVKGCYEDSREREQFVRDLRKHREVHNRELQLRRADGSVQWSLVNAVWIDDPADDESEVLVGTVVDISARKRMERELRLSEDRYRRLFEQNLVGVFRSRPGLDGEVVECNQAFADIFGYDSPKEVTGRPARDFYPEGEDRHATIETFRKNRIDVQDEARLQRKDGSIVWALAHARLLEDPEHGRILEGTIFDVSDRVRSREAVERAKERFQSVFDISPVALTIVRAEGDDYVAVNREFEDVFGYDRRELLAGSVTGEDLWENPGERARIYRRLESGETVRKSEVRLRRSDGSVLEALFSASRLEKNGEQLLVAAIQDISHLKEVERELEHRSLHDALTGLPNRILFWDRLAHALERSRRTGETIAVFFLDLDGFKRINDEHGHATGDEALRQVAARLSSAIREADTLARVGGDEFGVLLEDLSNAAEAEQAARRVTDRFGAPVSVAGEEAMIRMSCGIAMAGGAEDGEDTVTADELVHRADRAMYAAKEEPGSSFHRYGPEIAEERTGRLRREIQLKEALERGDVVPYHQPIVDLEDGRMVGSEALARWIHPERGLVSPGAFIPLAEETGLIVELGRQVARSACAQLTRWSEDGVLPHDFRLHLNLSARELGRPDLVEVLEEMFREVGLAPERVAFEVTETVAVEGASIVKAIRALGCPVAVDDFGTQYATLERLASMELDSLKLDRLFVDRIGASSRHEAVLEASLTLAEAMGLIPVAEGVETEEQREWLLKHGCRFAQGFLFAPAVPVEQFTGWLRSATRLPV